MLKFLVVSPIPSHPQDAGHRSRIYSMLSEIKREGHKIIFAYVRMSDANEKDMKEEWDEYFPIAYKKPWDPLNKTIYDIAAKTFGIKKVLPRKIDDWYTDKITACLEKLRDRFKPDIVLVEYGFLSKAFECFGPDTMKILDTMDIFGDRHRLFEKYRKLPGWFYTTKNEESKACNRADVIIAIQENEAKYFRGITDKKVITVSHIERPKRKKQNKEKIQERLLFMGSSNIINKDGLKWFLEEVFPTVRKEFPAVELEIVGECAEKISAPEGVILTGKVKDLGPYYHRAGVVINPVRFGTGLKIKTIEALAYGKPLVTTRVGADGLEQWAGRAFLLGEDAGEFAGAICSILLSKEVSNKLRLNALAFSRRNNEKAMQPLLDEIQKLNGKQSHAKNVPKY